MFVCKFCLNIYFLILLDISLGVGLLRYMVILSLTYWEISKLSSTVAAAFHGPTSNMWRLQWLHILTSPCHIFHVLIRAILTRANLYSIVVFMCIFLMVNDIDHLSCALWPFVDFLGRSVYPKQVLCHLKKNWVRLLYIFWVMDAYQIWKFKVFFSNSIGCLLAFLLCSLMNKVLILINSNLSFSFIAYASVVMSMKPLLDWSLWIFISVFF